MRHALHIIARNACRVTIAGCALVLAASCASEPIPKGSRYVVASPFAEFYKNGPVEDVNLDVVQHTFDNDLLEQQTGPDFQLPKGATVTMLKREEGYSKVMTDSGIAGYVPNDQLKPAPRLACAAATKPQNERSIRRRTRAAPPSRDHEEQLDLGDLPLPLPR